MIPQVYRDVDILKLLGRIVDQHTKEFKEDFIASQWKVAFLKRLFKVPMRYDRVYSILDKIKKD